MKASNNLLEDDGSIPSPRSILAAASTAVEPGLGIAPVPGDVVGVVRINSNTVSVHLDFINIS